MSADYPDFVARFYDIVYARIRDGVDNDFYLRQIAASDGPALELGVGTGRLFRPALEQGADIDGVDLSPSMIERLRAKLTAAQRTRVQVADAVTMQLPRQYALVVAPFRMLSHVQRVEDQLRLLDNVHAHLRPGGRFIFDLYVPAPKVLAGGLSDVVDFEGEYAPGLRLTRRVSAHADVVNQITRGTMTFAWDEEGQLVVKSWDFTLRFYFRFELEHLIARSALELVAMHGDFSAGALTEQSKEFVVICRRPVA